MNYKEIRALIVGLGSMGKRRVRCLKALGVESIHGFDLREDRRKEAADKYGIPTHGDFAQAVAEAKPTVLILSVPPHIHHIYMKEAVARRLPFFVEASVVDTDMAAVIAESEKAGSLAAPSATMVFHPAVRMIKQLVTSGELGKISNVIHHSGQYLPDWHTYEKVSDYYVCRKDTGGAREIVPFELTWLADIFGFPKKVGGAVRKTIEIEGADQIDDTYNCLYDYDSHLMILVVDVVSRFATRRLVINGSKKQLVWDWDEKSVKIYDPQAGKWDVRTYDQGKAAAGYNVNIGETMYVEEIRAFLDAFIQRKPFVHDLKFDHAVLRMLYAVEEASNTGKTVDFKP